MKKETLTPADPTLVKEVMGMLSDKVMAKPSLQLDMQIQRDEYGIQVYFFPKSKEEWEFVHEMQHYIRVDNRIWFDTGASQGEMEWSLDWSLKKTNK